MNRILGIGLPVGERRSFGGYRAQARLCTKRPQCADLGHHVRFSPPCPRMYPRVLRPDHAFSADPVGHGFLQASDLEADDSRSRPLSARVTSTTTLVSQRRAVGRASREHPSRSAMPPTGLCDAELGGGDTIATTLTDVAKVAFATPRSGGQSAAGACNVLLLRCGTAGRRITCPQNGLRGIVTGAPR